MTNPTSAAARPDLTAILFDLRSVIGLLFAVYGLVLTVLGLLGSSPEDLAKAGGIALNLWTGVAMLIGAVIFFAWVLARPPLPPSAEELAAAETDDRPPGH